MISVNGQAISINHFPDGTQLLGTDEKPFKDNINFKWLYESDEELVTLIFLAKHFDDVYPGCHKNLTMPYAPNSRMDRTKRDSEVFTLKHFCDVINGLGFERVYILDPHSNVTPALLHRVVVRSPESLILDLVGRLGLGYGDYVYYPDEGAYKRYADLFPSKINVLVGHKVRDWETGRIQGLKITNRDDMGYEYNYFRGKRVIMIDDIISYGGTLAYSADELKKLGFKNIYAYATHTENSILDPEKGTLLKRLEDGTVDHIYTTCSTFSGSHDKITVFDV